MSAYAEIAVTTNYSFLCGASHPRELVQRAAELGLSAIGIADRNTLAGVVRAYTAHQEIEGSKPKLLVGARLVFIDGTPDILAYPTDRAAYARLCRLLSVGKLRAPKGECYVRFGDLLDWQEGLLLVVLPSHPSSPLSTVEEPQNFWNKNNNLSEASFSPPSLSVIPANADAQLSCNPSSSLKLDSCPRGNDGLRVILERLNQSAPNRVWLGVSLPHHGDDAARLAHFKTFSTE